MARAQAIGYQVNQIIKAHNGIRESKMQSRATSGLKGQNNHNISDKFHSYKSLDNVRRELTDLGKFAKKEYKIKDMSNITKEVVQEWIKSKDITYKTASNYLSNIYKVADHFSINRAEIKEIREELKQTISKTPPLAKETRAYKYLDKIKLQNPRADVAFRLQRDYGLRVKEATHINLNRQLKDNILEVQGKGGKIIHKELDKNLVKEIKELSQNGIFKIAQRTYAYQLKQGIEATGQVYNGTHGIRHSYAQNKLEEGYTKQEVSEMMGHNREEITDTYLR